MKDTEIAWAAGFFDGEGSASFFIRKDGTKRVCLAVVQAGEYAEVQLLRFMSAIGGLGRINGPYQPRNPRHLIRWQWSCGKKEAILVLDRLGPYLGPQKRADIMYALEQDHALSQ